MSKKTNNAFFLQRKGSARERRAEGGRERRGSKPDVLLPEAWGRQTKRWKRAEAAFNGDGDGSEEIGRSVRRRYSDKRGVSANDRKPRRDYPALRRNNYGPQPPGPLNVPCS